MKTTDVLNCPVTLGDLKELRTELEIVAERMEDLCEDIHKLTALQESERRLLNFLTDPGKVMKQIRIKVGISQKELAPLLDVTANYLSLLEHNKRDPSLDFVRRFFKELGGWR